MNNIVKLQRGGLLTDKTVRKVLLICGLLSSLLYIGTDILASLSWEGYSYTSQAYSELMAFGAPTRAFLLKSTFIYNLMVIAFGFCIMKTDSSKRSLFYTGIFLIGYAVVGIITPSLFPAPLREAEATFINLMHIPLTALEVLFIVLSMAFGAAAHGKQFRLYSAVTILILILSGAFSGSAIPHMTAQGSTPLLGIVERSLIYGYMLWVMIFAVLRLREENHWLIKQNQ